MAKIKISEFSTKKNLCPLVEVSYMYLFVRFYNAMQCKAIQCVGEKSVGVK